MPGLKGRGVSIFPALPQRRELPSDPVVHGIVRRFAQADQVPELVCILGIILGRPYVVNNLGLDSSSVPGSLLTAVTISTERLGANSLPAPVFAAVVKTHTRTPGPFLPRAPAIASALSGKRKRSRGQQQTHSCVYHWPRLSKHWPRLMSIRCSVLQKRQKTTRLVAVVSSSILSSFLLPRQVGHWRNPSFTVSLTEKS